MKEFDKIKNILENSKVLSVSKLKASEGPLFKLKVKKENGEIHSFGICGNDMGWWIEQHTFLKDDGSKNYCYDISNCLYEILNDHILGEQLFDEFYIYDFGDSPYGFNNPLGILRSGNDIGIECKITNKEWWFSEYEVFKFFEETGLNLNNDVLFKKLLDSIGIEFKLNL